MSYEFSDGGRVDSGFLREKLDCAVRAVAIATGASYPSVHSFFKSNGRRGRCRTKNFLKLIPNIESRFHCTFTELKVKPGTRFQSDNKAVLSSGRFIARQRGHVYAVVDGVALDTSALLACGTLLKLWKIT